MHSFGLFIRKSDSKTLCFERESHMFHVVFSSPTLHRSDSRCWQRVIASWRFITRTPHRETSTMLRLLCLVAYFSLALATTGPLTTHFQNWLSRYSFLRENFSAMATLATTLRAPITARRAATAGRAATATRFVFLFVLRFYFLFCLCICY